MLLDIVTTDVHMLFSLAQGKPNLVCWTNKDKNKYLNYMYKKRNKLLKLMWKFQIGGLKRVSMD